MQLCDFCHILGDRGTGQRLTMLANILAAEESSPHGGGVSRGPGCQGRNGTWHGHFTWPFSWLVLDLVHRVKLGSSPFQLIIPELELQEEKF